MSMSSVMDSSMSTRCFLFAKRDGAIKLLALQRSGANKRWKGKWELPGGKIEASEALLPATSMVRELDEETGLDPEMKLLTVVFFNEKNGSVPFGHEETTHMTYYWMGIIKGERLKLSEEHSAFKWCTLSQFKALNLTPRTKTAFRLFQKRLSVFAEECEEKLLLQPKQ